MSTDSQFQQAVIEELGCAPSVVSAHVGVAANVGVVTLAGHVASYTQKHAAEAATRRVCGVKAVAKELEVRLSIEAKCTDQDIAAAAIDWMGWDVTIPKDAVKMQVGNGWVILTGQVDWYYQQGSAGKELCHLFGVAGLSNQITIKPRADTANISDEITHALHRSWFFDAETVKVRAKGGGSISAAPFTSSMRSRLLPQRRGPLPASRACRTISP